MKWFEHESTSHGSPKMLRLLNRYGLAGYGLYWVLVELIAQHWEKYECGMHPEYDFELISGLVRSDDGVVPDMIRWMVLNRLFVQEDDGGLACPSLNDHLGEGAKKHLRKQLKSIPSKLNSGTVPEGVRKSAVEVPSQTKLNKTKLKETTSSSRGGSPVYSVDFLRFYGTWIGAKKKKAVAFREWKKLKPDSELVNTICEHLEERQAKDPEWLKEGRKYQGYPDSFIRDRKWEDEWEPSANGTGGVKVNNDAYLDALRDQQF